MVWKIFSEDVESAFHLREEFLREYFILGVLLNGWDPCFESKLKGTNGTNCAFLLSAVWLSIKNQN